MSDEISVIICTLNSAENIEEVLKSVKENNPKEIILVDADSTDGTREIASEYADKILSDPRKGLAVARNIGVENATGEYIFFLGPDNIILPGSLDRLREYINEKSYVGAAMLTELKYKNSTYWTKGANERWQLRFYEGEREVIGTPYMYKKEILEKYRYSDEMTWSDDSDLCLRIKNDGLKVGYSDIYCLEVGVDDFKALIKRYNLYGLSDYQYYKKFSGNWDKKRKKESKRHPLKSEFLLPMSKINSFFRKIYFLPFFFIITAARYNGWRKAAKKDKKTISG